MNLALLKDYNKSVDCLDIAMKLNPSNAQTYN